MEYGIVSSGIRNRTDLNSAVEREAEKQRMIAQARQAKVLKFQAFDDSSDNCLRAMSERDSGIVGAGIGTGNGNYGLRDNPKKSKRLVDSKEVKVCKECGKGFQSLKALCGHMASHSDKDRARLRQCSDTESSGPKKPRKRRGSRRVRYRNVGAGGGSGSVVVEREQQEVAISLMLLSRDCRRGGGGGQSSMVAESSSNDNSVVLEAKSSSRVIDTAAAAAKVVVVVTTESTTESENSDSGYFRNGPKKNNESEVSVSVSASVEPGKRRSSEEDGTKYELRKRSTAKIESAALFGGYYYSDEPEPEPNYLPQKKSKYECSTCNKTFPSHTALGGHRAGHAKTGNNGCCGGGGGGGGSSVCESGGEISIEINAKPVVAAVKTGPKKSKGHECPICFRIFKSGQALGGHKRSHFVGGGREAYSATTTIARPDPGPEPEPEPEITVLFDLNLPAAMEEEEKEEEEW